MPRVKFTPSFVRQVKCPRERAKIDYFDTEYRGLMLEVRASGGKTYYQRYREARGRERQYKIGSAAVLTLDQARRRGREILAKALLGADPQQERREIRAIPTLAQFVGDQYLPFVQTSKRSWRTDETVLRLHILPALGRLGLDEMTNTRVSDLINALSAKGYSSGTTNRVLVIIRYIYNLAAKWNVLRSAHNPTEGLSPAPDNQRERFLTEQEAQRLCAAIDADENQNAARAIKLLLLTGARRNEVTHARWEYIEWENRTLLVPISKSGRPRRVSLNASAIELLRSVPRTSSYIFPSPSTARPCPSLFFPWDRIRKRASLRGLRLHDLRHSFASFLVNKGVSLYIVQGLLGHSHPKTTQRYAHLAQQTLLDAAELLRI